MYSVVSKIKQFFTKTYNKDDTVPFAWYNTEFKMLKDEEIVKTYCDGTLENCKHKEDIGTCKSCIKQYFERKSENGN